MRRLICLAGLGALVAACSASTPSPSPSPNVDVTGILMVDVDEQVQTGPMARRFANAFGDAMLLAETNGDDLGYPWLDPLSGELILSAATPRGRELIEAAGITVPYRIREVTHGAAELRRIQDDVTLLGARGVPGSEVIFMTLPDHRDNRTLIVMSELDRALLEYLAGHYPVDALAVQVDPDFPGAGPASP